MVELLDAQGRVAWVMAALPPVPPAGFRLISRGEDGAQYLRHDGLAVIMSGARELDGKRWLHVSCSYASKLPSWADLRLVKMAFLGERYAVQVFPPSKYYVNINPYVLHLFSCEDGHPLPEFSRYGASL